MSSIDNKGGISINVEGMDRLAALLRNLPDNVKQREIRRIMRKALAPVVSSARAYAPVARRTVTRAKGKVKYEPGNLRNSISTINIRSTRYATVEVGALAGARKKYDGYYGFFVHEGTVHIKKRQLFIARAWDANAGSVAAESAKEIAKEIDRAIKRLQK